MAFNYQENTDSQIPARRLLQRLGYQYLTPEEALSFRHGITSQVILEEVLREQLARLNRYRYKGKTYEFSAGNLNHALQAIKNIAEEGLVRSSERIYELLTLGRSLEEYPQGDKKSFPLQYIDWRNWANNRFHVTEEFEVQGKHGFRRPDLVCFVNGIPFVVIEAKRRDKNASVAEAISQHLRNQKDEQGIPRLYQYAQFLLAIQPNQCSYATTDTPARFWSVWKEKRDLEAPINQLLHRPLIDAEGREILPAESRLPTEQDRLLYSLCRPERLLELCYGYVLFDNRVKKVPRYQQYFAVKETLERVRALTPEQRRQGGVIWHTQGSGKSLTMVMLAKALALDPAIGEPRVILVTDRINLDKQIWKTFNHCGKLAERAQSGVNLIELLQDDGVEVVTTILDKFDSAHKRSSYQNDSPNLFVLIDESHRSHYGEAHTRMRKMLPQACYLGFTGTPLLKREKSTAQKFGGFIHQYTIREAVEDGAVLPLLYEGRAAKLSINKRQLEKGFDRVTEPLPEYATKELKQKYARISEVYKSQQVIEEVAYDLAQHYCANWQGTGFKAQLAVPDKLTAIRYLQIFDAETDPKLKLNARVVISPPDTREGHEDVYQDTKDEVQKFWQAIMQRHGNQDNYETYVTDKFKEEDSEVELLIVVSKLLTGFDAPRNTILYLAKPLAEHNLLQAIARVNRLFEGKEHGYIVDYVGILGKLDQALTTYSALEEFEEEDLESVVVDVGQEVAQLSQRYSEVWDVFKTVENKDDNEALERFLADEERRETFYDRLSAFARCLHLSLSTDRIYQRFSESQINHFKMSLKRFQQLRRSVQLRYAERVDYQAYESRIRKLMDTHISAEDIMTITDPINIFDDQNFKAEVERVTGSTASQADAIAYRLKREITERMNEDPVFYQKFADLIQAAIEAFEEHRLSEKEYLEEIYQVRDDYAQGRQADLPEVLTARPQARAFFGILKKQLQEAGYTIDVEQLTHAGLDLDATIAKLTIRDWQRNEDVHNQIKNHVEDYLLEKQAQWGIEMGFDLIDLILDQTLAVAQRVYPS